MNEVIKSKPINLSWTLEEICKEETWICPHERAEPWVWKYQPAAREAWWYGWGYIQGYPAYSETTEKFYTERWIGNSDAS